MNIVQNAKKHFADKVSADLSCVEVPEWGEAGEGDGEKEPAKIYYRKAMSHKTQRQINQYAKEGDIEALIEILMLRGLDADGKKLFKPSHRTEFRNFVDPEVMGRICEEMGEDDTTLEDATGN